MTTLRDIACILLLQAVIGLPAATLLVGIPLVVIARELSLLP